MAVTLVLQIWMQLYIQHAVTADTYGVLMRESVNDVLALLLSLSCVAAYVQETSQ